MIRVAGWSNERTKIKWDKMFSRNFTIKNTCNYCTQILVFWLSRAKDIYCHEKDVQLIRSIYIYQLASTGSIIVQSSKMSIRKWVKYIGWVWISAGNFYRNHSFLMIKDIPLISSWCLWQWDWVPRLHILEQIRFTVQVADVRKVIR